MNGLAEKVVIVAGGANGIGRATALRLGVEGARVLVGDIDEGGAERTAAEVIALGGSAFAKRFDLADEISCRELVEAAKRTWGGVDGLYNVGADLSTENLGRDTDIVTTPIDVIMHTLQVNLLGYVFTTRYAVPEMLLRGGGSLVHTTSGVTRGMPRFCAYGMSKNAVIALSRHVAARWGREGVRSNAIDPGIVLTDNQLQMNSDDDRAGVLATMRSDRFGEPEEVAAAVAFLLSPEARWINGQTYPVCSHEGAR